MIEPYSVREFDCIRCKTLTTGRFYGMCPDCTDELRTKMVRTKSAVTDTPTNDRPTDWTRRD